MNPLLLAVAENRLLEVWRTLRRHPAQLNALHDADAELLPIGEGLVLAATVDTVEEEIALGLYPDPETIGWVAAAASLSDLSAVGAAPLGLLASVRAPATAPETFLAGVARGLDGAAAAAGAFVLGGDTGFGPTASVTVTALGLVAGERPLTRRGLRTGDVLYSTAPLGTGAAWAAHVLFGAPFTGDYRPPPRGRDVAALRPHVHAAMDTSDGLVATVDQLARLNGVGVALDPDLEALLSPAAAVTAAALSLPALTLLAAHHGEHELVLAVAPEQQAAFTAAAAQRALAPIRVGEVVCSAGLTVASMPPRAVDSAALRDLSALAGPHPREYLARLVALTT